MSDYNLTNIKATVSKFLNSKSKFGSYTAKKAELDKKYEHYSLKHLDGPDAELYKDAKGTVAEARGGKNYYNYVIDFTTITNKDSMSTSVKYTTNSLNDDKFNRIEAYDAHNRLSYSIHDANGNGRVDNYDVVIIRGVDAGNNKRQDMTVGELMKSERTN